MKYYPPQFNNFEEYKKDCWYMALLTWASCVILIVAMIVLIYFEWKIAPWIIFAFLIAQNIPLAIRYTTRYKILKEESEE